MRKLSYAFVAATALVGAAPVLAAVAPAGSVPASTNSALENVQYRWHGQAYCFYPVGWHGPGWYRCGWQHRRGRGWGGPMGWHSWEAPGRGGMGRERPGDHGMDRGRDRDRGRDMDRSRDRDRDRDMDRGPQRGTDRGSGASSGSGTGSGTGTGAGTGPRSGSGGGGAAPSGERPRDVRPPSGTSGGGGGGAAPGAQ